MRKLTKLYNDYDEEKEFDERNFNQLSVSERLTKFSAICDYLIIHCDMFAIYKGTHRQCSRSKYKFYLRPELKMMPNYYDRWFPKIETLSRLTFIALSIRYLMICLVQLIKHHATTYGTRKSSPSIQVKTTANASEDYDEIPIMIDTKLTLFLKEYKLFYIFGNILSDFSGVTLSIHAFLLVCSLYLVQYIPNCYKIKPMDALSLRIGLNPSQERKRINLIIGEQINSFLDSMRSSIFSHPFRSCLSNAVLNRFYWQQQQQQQQQKKFVRETKTKPTFCGADDFSRQVRFNFDPAIRASRYSDEHPKKIWHSARNFTIISVSIAIPFGLMVQNYITHWAIDAKCRSKGLKICRLSDTLSIFELYTLVEMMIIMYFFGYVMCVVIVTILMHLFAQLDIIDEMELDLNDMLNALKLLNSSRRDLNCEQINSINMTINQHAPHLNDALIKLLVKTKITLSEFIGQAEFLSEQMSSFIVCFGSGLVLSLTTGKMDGPDIEELRNIIIRALWISANSIPLICAHQSARMIKLHKIAWSILAQLSDPHIEIHLRADFVLESWRKFIESSCFSDTRCSIRPFGIGLTFRQILQCNFYLTSLAVLVFR